MRWSAFVVSLLGHATLIAAVAGLVAEPAAVRDPAVIPVRRASEQLQRPALQLRLEEPGRDAPAVAVAQEAVVALDTADPRYRPYLLGVKRRIWERWKAPAVPADRPASGTLVIEFTLTRSGRLAASGVREPSGVPALDRAALEAVTCAVPFTPLPPSIAGESLRVRARFIYD